MRVLRSRWSVVFLGVLLARDARAQGVTDACQLNPCAQGAFGPGGTWNVYELVMDPEPWKVAAEQAAERRWQGIAGHLVEIGSAAENAAIENFAGDTMPWIGLTDREGAAPRVEQAGVVAPQESSRLADPLRQGWAWTSGQPFAYQNWAPGEPNDYRDREDAVAMLPDGRWIDQRGGWVQDDPLPPVLQPGTSPDESSPTLGTWVIEYPTGRATPVADLPVAHAPPRLPARLPGLAGDWGSLGVTDFLPEDMFPGWGLDVAEWLEAEVDAPIPTPHRETRMPRANASCLEGNNQGGPAITDPPIDFPSAAPSCDGVVRVTVAQGTVHVPLAGRYTVNVHSSDGFALSIGGQPFAMAAGDGLVDGRDPSVLYFPQMTGDAATRGVLDLPAGRHALKFLTWSSRGDAFWEISTALGEHPLSDDIQWQAIGDGSLARAQSRSAIARLTEPAAVWNVDADGGGAVRSSREAAPVVEAARRDGTAKYASSIDTIVLRDVDGICCGRPGAGLPSEQQFLFPLEAAAKAAHNGPQDMFSTGVRGVMTVDDHDNIPGERIQVTMALFANDGAHLAIEGANFLSGSMAAELVEAADGSVQLATLPGTLGSAAMGTLQLLEGQVYPWSAYHYERGGDAGLELWTAPGNLLDQFDAHVFMPLSRGASPATTPLNVGWTLVSSDQPLVAGDFNGDRILDARDLDLQALAIQRADPAYDWNRDGSVDRADRLQWVREQFGTTAGDADLDGAFDSRDLIAMFQAGGYEQTLEVGWQAGDFDGDLRFRSADLVLALQEGGYSSASPVRVSVPEPSSAATAVLGAACLWGVARRRMGWGLGRG